MERLAGQIMLMSGVRRALLAFVSGAFAVLALEPFGFFAAMFVSFTLLVLMLDGASGDPSRSAIARLFPAFGIGWMFGFGYFVAGLYWLGNALLVEAEDFAWALPLAVLGLPAGLALFYGLATALARLFWLDGFGRIVGLAAAFGLAEWLRSVSFTGFPWNAIGQGLMPSPVMMQSAGLVSADGMTVIAVLIFAAPALLFTRKGMVPGLGLAALLLAGHVGYGMFVLSRPPAADPAAPAIRLVQPMIDQSRKINGTDRSAIFEEHLAMSTRPVAEGAKRPDVIVWPETSIPFILTENPSALSRIADVLDDDQILVAGAVRSEATGTGDRFYNSIYVINGKGEILGAYDKLHLVPFGEYLPFEALAERVGLTAIAAKPGGFSAGADRPVLPLRTGIGVVPLICYEIIFGGEIGREAAQAQAILNITNDGWFGDTAGPRQHLHQARLRAAETGLPVIRNSNSGISAIIDAYGGVVQGLDFGVNGLVDGVLPALRVPIQDAGQRNRNFWLLLAGTFLFAAASRTRLGRIFN